MAKFLEQLKQIWLKLDKQKRLFLIGGTLLFLVAFSIFVYQISRVDYELLYGNLSQIEQDEIIQPGDEYTLPEGKDAFMCQTPQKWAELMKGRYPQRGSWLGNIDRQAWDNPFLNQVNYQRAKTKSVVPSGRSTVFWTPMLFWTFRIKNRFFGMK